jgi:hypothetical protein
LASGVPYELSFSAPLTINHDDFNTFGWLVNRLSERRLPIWLSVGIEAIARENIGLPLPCLNELSIEENFGDFYFAPRFRDTPQREEAIVTAYHFVSFLHENGLLSELARQYVYGNIREANAKAKTHFYSFAGRPMTPFILELRHGDFIAVRENLRSHRTGTYALLKYTDWGNYVFLFDDSFQIFPIESLQEQIDYIDRATQFAVEWYSEVFDFDYEPITHLINHRNIMRAGNTEYAAYADSWTNIISYAGLSNQHPYFAAHEVSHVLEYRVRWLSPYPPFSEGLAEVINLIFNDNLSVSASDSRRYTTDIHHSAHSLFATGAYSRISDISERFTPDLSSVYIPELSARTSAISFVKYLIDTYGTKMYFQVHWDIARFPYVFGITIDEMILEWREFLVGYAALL